MKSLEDIAGIVKKANVKPTSEMRSKVLDEALELQRKRKQQNVSDTHAWRMIMHSRMVKFGVAAVIVFGVFSGLYYFTGSIDGATPAFASVIDNVLSQKWVYMFEEDRNSGIIRDEYWYNPKGQKLFGRSHTADDAFMIDLTIEEMTEYRNGKLIISKPNDFQNPDSSLSERLSMINGLLIRHEEKGAVITQKAAIYNNKPVYLYEIEMAFPKGRWGMGEAKTQTARSYRYVWIVDIKTKLPIICEYKSTMLYDMNDRDQVVSSRRYAFDYSDSGPSDIYALGVPDDAEIIDERPSPKIQELSEKINKLKNEYYRSYAAIIMHRDLPQYIAIRDGQNIREDRLELRINYSDFELNKEQYAREMGDSFDSIYDWIKRKDGIIRRDIYISTGILGYDTNARAIKVNAPIEMDHDPHRLTKFFSYCWCYVADGEIVEDEFSKENALICVLTEWGDKYFYDPAKNYFCVRVVNKAGEVKQEMIEFGVTPGGMIYPKVFRSAYYIYNEDKTETIFGGYYTYRIYATDLTASLASLADPKSLPNFVDHRKLTREIIEKRQAAIDPNAPAIMEYAGFTPLHMAIYRKDIDKVKQYLRKGADVEPDSDTGATPMELAVSAGSLELVKLLHENGADFFSNDEQKRSCLGLAVKNRAHDIAQYMLESGLDANAVYKHGKRPLHYAAANGDVLMVRTLLEYGAELEPVNLSGYTPLAQAVESYAQKIYSWPGAEKDLIGKYQETIRLFAEKGADINQRLQNHSKNTILMRTVYLLRHDSRNADQQVELLEFLLGLGADLHLMTERSSPFYTAVEEQRYDLAKVLLDNGADPWVLPKDVLAMEHQNNLLHMAKRWRRDKLYDLLYPYMKGRYESTNEVLADSGKAVMKAILSNDSDAVKTLCLDHPNYRNSWQGWLKEIRKLYTGHEGLAQDVRVGWFTVNGFADVYVPLPEGSKEKSIVLGFFHHPDGTWKCMYFKKLDHLPEAGYFGIHFYGFGLEDWRKDVFKAAGKSVD